MLNSIILTIYGIACADTYSGFERIGLPHWLSGVG